MTDYKKPKITLSIIIRSVLFNCYFYICFTFFLIFIVTPLSFSKSPVKMRKAILAMINSTIYMFDKIANVKIVEKGLENIPEGKGFIYCAKHMSNLDAYFLYRRSPNLTALAKRELYLVPLVGRILRKMGVLSINRGAGEAQKQTPVIAKELVERKIPMIIFAEGTRTRIGERKKLKSGAYYYQKEGDLDVIVVAHNSGFFWRRDSFIKYPGTLIVEYHPALPSDLGKAEFMTLVEKQLLDRSDELMEL